MFFGKEDPKVILLYRNYKSSIYASSYGANHWFHGGPGKKGDKSIHDKNNNGDYVLRVSR